MNRSLTPRRPAAPQEEFLELSWEMFGELCRALALRVGSEYNPELIVGIARAGVIPGAVIASILGIDFHSMLITRKEGREIVRERPEILSAAPEAARGRRVLIVDQICSSGETLRLGLAAVRDRSPAEVRTATMFKRPRSYAPDHFALETAATIIYPWDRKIFQGEDLVVNPLYDRHLDENG
jgi:uncharacterized protein